MALPTVTPMLSYEDAGAAADWLVRVFAQTKSAGATILSEPEDQPFGTGITASRISKGQGWMFATHIRDVPPEEWGAETK